MFPVPDPTLHFSAAYGALPVVWSPSGGAERRECLAFLVAPGAPLFGGAVVAQDWTLTYPSASLPDLGNGEEITVNGVAYRVREVTPVDDGAISQASLARV